MFQYVPLFSTRFFFFFFLSNNELARFKVLHLQYQQVRRFWIDDRKKKTKKKKRKEARRNEYIEWERKQRWRFWNFRTMSNVYAY